MSKILEVYNNCPKLIGKRVFLEKTKLSDAKELLDCYSDKKAIKFFNSDNCNGDTFYYDTLEKMTKAIEFWNFSYDNQYFVRWSVYDKKTYEIIGTVEMCKRDKEDKFFNYGILRIDLKSSCENKEILEDILKINNKYFYNLFEVQHILTKSIKDNSQRCLVLKEDNWTYLEERLGKYDDYYVR